jgi:hypothetical protein
MPAGMLTLLDVMKNGLGDQSVVIDETMVATPEVTGIHPLTKQQIPNVANARTVAGVTYETTALVELPTVAARNMNEGTDPQKSRSEKRTASCCAMTPRWGIDKIAETIDNSAAKLLAKEARAFMAAYLKWLGQVFYYGVTVDAKACPGLLQAVDAAYTVDATGTGSAVSSVYAVKFGEDAVQWLSGNNGQNLISDPRIGDFTGTNGKPVTGIIQELVSRPGLFVGSKKYVGRIKNLHASTANKTLTGDMLGELVNTKMGLAYRPDVIFLTPRSLEQYRQNLQAITSSTMRIQTPTEFEGIPLVPTESLTNAEVAA